MKYDSAEIRLRDGTLAKLRNLRTDRPIMFTIWAVQAICMTATAQSRCRAAVLR